jgi:hypothetical protein
VPDQADLPAPQILETRTYSRAIQALVQEQVDELPLLALDIGQFLGKVLRANLGVTGTRPRPVRGQLLAEQNEQACPF